MINVLIFFFFMCNILFRRQECETVNFFYVFIYVQHDITDCFLEVETTYNANPPPEFGPYHTEELKQVQDDASKLV